MIADDHVGIRMLYKALLTQAGHEIIAETDNGVDTLTAYVQVNPDLLIIDNNMEKMNGIDVVRHISRKYDNATIIMCTGDSEKIAQEAFQLGVVEVISKPFDTNHFVEIVSTALKSVV